MDGGFWDRKAAEGRMLSYPAGGPETREVWIRKETVNSYWKLGGLDIRVVEGL